MVFELKQSGEDGEKSLPGWRRTKWNQPKRRKTSGDWEKITDIGRDNLSGGGSRNCTELTRETEQLLGQKKSSYVSCRLLCEG